MVIKFGLAQLCERSGPRNGLRYTTRDGHILRWSDVAREEGYNCVRDCQTLSCRKEAKDGHFSRDRVVNARNGDRGSQGGLAPRTIQP